MHAFTYCGGCIHSWGCHKIPGFGNFLFRSSYNKRIHNVHPCGPAAITWKLYLLLVYTSISDSMFGNVSKTWLHFFRRKKVTFLYICFVLYLMFVFTFLFQMYTYNIITLYTHFSYFFAFSYLYHITWKRKYGKKKSEKTQPTDPTEYPLRIKNIPHKYLLPLRSSGHKGIHLKNVLLQKDHHGLICYSYFHMRAVVSEMFKTHILYYHLLMYVCIHVVICLCSKKANKNKWWKRRGYSFF